MGGKNVVAQLRLNNSAKVMPQAGIVTIPLEAVFIYGIGNINRLRFKIACYFFMKDLNAASLESAMSMIAGTCRSMGVVVGD